MYNCVGDTNFQHYKLLDVIYLYHASEHTPQLSLSILLRLLQTELGSVFKVSSNWIHSCEKTIFNGLKRCLHLNIRGYTYEGVKVFYA